MPTASNSRRRASKFPISNQGFQLRGESRSLQRPQEDDAGRSVPRRRSVWRGFIARGKPFLEIALVPGELYPELSVGGVQRYSGADFPDAPIETPDQDN